MRKEELRAALLKAFLKFRATPWFRVVYLVLLGAIVALLLLYTASGLSCLIFLLIPITVFVVPYWMGERKIRRFAVNGAVVFTIALLVAAAMSTQAVFAQGEAREMRSVPGFLSDPAMALSNGTVHPYQGRPGETFTFRVNLTTQTDSSHDQFDVYLNLTAVDGIAVSHSTHKMAYSPGPISSPNPRNGTWYEWNMTLGGSIYLYFFSVTDRDGNWTAALNDVGGRSDVGPVTASAAAFFGFWVYLLVVSGGLPIEFLFYLGILFLWWYMIRTREMARQRGRRTPREAPPKESAPSEGKSPETEGKASKAAAFTCTNCGADVSEDDVKCPKCGATFED